jgi:hypothetical protein
MNERLTDEEIEECREAGNRSYRRHSGSISGQQITPQDSPDWHFARAIEAAVLAHVTTQQSRSITAMVKWLEANQPDVFARGLWDAINAGNHPKE